MSPNKEDLANFIDFTLFSPTATRGNIEKLCAEAREKTYHAVCINGSRVELARTLLEESTVQIVALVGFPLGAGDSDAKRYETEIAVDQGAHEIDFVINLGRLKDGDHKYVLREMRDIAEAADERPVKAVLETHLLTREETILACQLALDSGVQFVSVSAAFHAPPITVAEVTFLRETLGKTFGLKAASSTADIESIQHLMAAGATRIGLMVGEDAFPG